MSLILYHNTSGQCGYHLVGQAPAATRIATSTTSGYCLKFVRIVFEIWWGEAKMVIKVGWNARVHPSAIYIDFQKSPYIYHSPTLHEDLITFHHAARSLELGSNGKWMAANRSLGAS